MSLFLTPDASLLRKSTYVRTFFLKSRFQRLNSTILHHFFQLKIFFCLKSQKHWCFFFYFVQEMQLYKKNKLICSRSLLARRYRASKIACKKKQYSKIIIQLMQSIKLLGQFQSLLNLFYINMKINYRNLKIINLLGVFWSTYLNLVLLF